MTSVSAAGRLTGLALSLHLQDEALAQRRRRICDVLFSQSRDIRQPNFQRIEASDLGLLFDAYDREFFEGQIRAALQGRHLGFRLSRRMTTAAGTTRRIRFRDGRVAFEIAIAAAILFDGFGPEDRSIAVCGVECLTRLEALQRIFEHELVHLIENLCWETSNCSAERFQQVAARVFGHRSHTHNLITRRERAAQRGIRQGTRVKFTFDGQLLTGRVNRVTKRATVLVEHPEGESYSDGLRYRRYYIPIQAVEPQDSR
jgi:hypothetical protein